jgi:hypothetical protein
VNILVSSREMHKERSVSPDKCGPGDEFISYSEIMESIRIEMEGQEF